MRRIDLHIAFIALSALIWGCASSSPDTSATATSPTPFSAYAATIVSDPMGAWRSDAGLEAMVKKIDYDNLYQSRDSGDYLDAAQRTGDATTIEQGTQVAVIDARDEHHYLNQDKWQSCEVQPKGGSAVWWVNCEDLSQQPR